jgi:hypothetical protein
MNTACSTNWEKRNTCGLLVEKSEGTIPLGRPRRVWVGSNKLDLGEKGRVGMDWIDLAQVRDQCRALVKTVPNFQVS